MGLDAVISELHKIFNLVNENFYGNELQEVLIVVAPQGKRSTLGWFTPDKVWRSEKEGAKHEVGITAENLNRGLVEIAHTMMHECVHLWCTQNKIKDTSNKGVYHNKKFKEQAESHGLFVEAVDKEENPEDAKRGWAFTSLQPESQFMIESWNLNENIFNSYSRVLVEKEKKEKKKRKKNGFKYTCDCDNIIKSKVELNVTCNDCGYKFDILEEENEDNEEDKDGNGEEKS